MNAKIKKELVSYFTGFLTTARKKRMEAVLKNRTRHITVVLEDIYQPHNASAILRTCEIFGIQDIHVIEKKNEYQPNTDIVRGADNWIDVIKHKSTKLCYKKLRQANYRIIAASPHQKGNIINKLSINKKIALVFGTEREGLSKEAIESADGFVIIPMSGFTESLNVSVSAAVCLYELTNRLYKSKVKFNLSADEKVDIRLDWLRKSVKNSELLEKRFFEKK